MKTIAYAALLTALLVACAQQPTKEATIEERDVAGSQTTNVATSGLETQGMSTAGIDSRPLEGNGAATSSTATSGAGTQGMSTGGMDGRALESNLQMPPKNAAGALGQRVIYFDFDSAVIREDARGIVEAHADFLKANGQAKVVLQGHADERGSREYNLALGQRRADSVSRALTVLGVVESRIETVSFGEEKPAVVGHDESAWQKNRRVEIVYGGE